MKLKGLQQQRPLTRAKEPAKEHQSSAKTHSALAPPATETSSVEPEAAADLQAQRAQDFANGSTAAVHTTARSALQLRTTLKTSPAEAASTKGLGVEANNLVDAALWSSAPNGLELGSKAEKAVSVSGSNRTLSTTTRLGGPGANADLGLSLDRMGLGVDATDHAGGEDRFAGLWVMKGWGMASAGRTYKNADGTIEKTSLGAFADASGGGLYSRLTKRMRNGDSLGLGIFAGAGADRTISDLGDYTGSDPSKKGFRGLTLKNSLNGSLLAMPSLHRDQLFGIGGRLSMSKSSEFEYSTFVPAKDARTLLFEPGNKVTKFLRNRARSLKMIDEPLQPPDLSKPEQIAVGDRLRLTTNGHMTGGLMLGPGFGTYIGAHGGMRGEFELNVSRPDADHIEVELVPTHVDMLQILGRAMIFDATAVQGKTRGLAQRFRFDMTQPQAVEAYQKLLQGELPSGLSAKEVPKFDAEQPPAAEFTLPKGVQSGPLEQVTGRSTRLHADFGFSLLTLGETRSSDSYERSLNLGPAKVQQRIRSLETRTTVPLSGDEDRGVRSVMTRTSKKSDGQWQDEQFIGLDLLAYVKDSKVRGLELNSDIEDLNETFGTNIGQFHVDALKQAQGIEISTHIDGDDLQKISEIDDVTARLAAEQADVRVSSLLTLIRALQSQTQPLHRAE